MHRLALKSALLAATVLVSASAVAQADQVPGSAPASLSPRVQNLLPEDVRPLAASGLRVFFRRFDKLTISVDAAGGNNPSNVISVTEAEQDGRRPEGLPDGGLQLGGQLYQRDAIVIANGDVRFNGKSVSWIDSETNDIPDFPGFFNSVLADVTSIVKPKVDAFNKAGTINFPIGESNAKNTSIDGEVLVVVFKDPSLPAKRTIALLFGGQQLAGDRFEVTLDKPIDPAKANAKAEMGLGVSYSYQSGGSQQYSVIDVNGKRLSTSARRRGRRPAGQRRPDHGGRYRRQPEEPRQQDGDAQQSALRRRALQPPALHHQDRPNDPHRHAEPVERRQHLLRLVRPVRRR